jgi:hypothetical protein
MLARQPTHEPGFLRMQRPLMTAEELLRFERKWRAIFMVFAVLLFVAMIDHLTRRPHGLEAVVCYSLGVIALAGCIQTARHLGDAERLDAVQDGVTTFDEDLGYSADLDN